jgi:hypothetical protein
MSPPRENPDSEPAFAQSRNQLRALLHGGGPGGGAIATEAPPAEPPAEVDGDGAPAEATPGRGREMSAHDVLELLEPAVEGSPPDVGGSDNLPVPLGEIDPSSELVMGAPALVRPTRLRHRLHKRRYGVAPFVRPSARRSRRKRRRDYRQLGFVELTPEKLHLRHRILPRTVIGVSAMLLAAGGGAAFAGASFYAYYDWRTGQTEAKAEEFAEGFRQTYTGATEQLQITRNQAIEEVNRSLDPLRTWAGDANAVSELPAKVGGGVFFVRTLDAAGLPSAGSAFVVSSSPTETLLLTSYAVVAAAQANPAPSLTIEKGGERIPVELVSWDADHDLALLRTARGNLPQLEWAPDDVRARSSSSRVYAMSGLGGQGSTRRRASPSTPARPGSATARPSRPSSGAGRWSTPTVRCSPSRASSTAPPASTTARSPTPPGSPTPARWCCAAPSR